jgi:hypothetical protein
LAATNDLIKGMNPQYYIADISVLNFLADDVRIAIFYYHCLQSYALTLGFRVLKDEGGLQIRSIATIIIIGARVYLKLCLSN